MEDDTKYIEKAVGGNIEGAVIHLEG